MAGAQLLKDVRPVADTATPSLESFVLDPGEVCSMNPVPLRFDPLGLPEGVNPYDHEEVPCSSAAEALEQRTGLPACQLEAPLVTALGQTIGTMVMAKLMGPQGLAGPPLPVVTSPPRGKLRLEKNKPQNRAPSTLRHFEQDPWTFVHSIGGRPVVEIRNPGSSMADVHVYDRSGKELILTSKILVAQKRDVMPGDSKESLRGENLPKLKSFLADNKALLAPNPKVRFEGTQ